MINLTKFGCCYFSSFVYKCNSGAIIGALASPHYFFFFLKFKFSGFHLIFAFVNYSKKNTDFFVLGNKITQGSINIIH